MLYGIAIFPEKHVQDAANSWRVRHDPHYCHISAHMTLREAEEWDEGMLKSAVAHLESKTAELSPFRVTFNRVSTFFPVSHVLYLAVEDPAPVEMLYNNICSGPLRQQLTKYVFTPHITLGQDIPADELHDLYGNLRMKSFQLTTVIESVHLLCQTEDGDWTPYRTFPLGHKLQNGRSVQDR